MRKLKIQKRFVCMVQDFKNIAIIGAGASGCVCAYYLLKKGYDVTLFDKGSFLRTILPTGGGRCNLAHAEYDIKELAQNYPRGEKFLYSIFSKFSTYDTIAMFEEMGISTYAQENGRIFPTSNNAKDVQSVILQKIKKANFVNEKVLEINKLGTNFKLRTQKADYLFTHVVIAIGGHSGYDLVNNLGLKITDTRPSLVGLNTHEDLKNLSGTVVKNVRSQGLQGDLLFTHFGISGPLIYSISSINAFITMPYELNMDLCSSLVDLQSDLNNFPHRDIKNILNKYLPYKVVGYILKDIGEDLKAHKINAKIRDLILERVHNFSVKVISTNAGEETVTAGGIDLDEINSKTMECKNIPNIYCIGELLNIDGFCGGFNLQNAWSTAYVCAMSI